MTSLSFCEAPGHSTLLTSAGRAVMGLLYGDTSGPSEAVRPLQDEDFMRRALELAARGIGFVSPNPTVGAVLVKDGQIVGEGWHERFGGPHAEVNAIRAAGHASTGATIYVTLEPCNHFGKTPPCTQAILSAGIKRVVIGTRDPNPKAAGGVEFLKAHGVTVEIDCLQQACRMLIAPFLKHVVTGLPWVISKAAMSLDGRIATRAGESKWITNDRSRACGHVLRAAVDGIVVGIGTVLADDPELTCRLPNGSANNPVRFVLDSTLKLPLNSRLCVTALQVRTVVVAAEPVSLVRKAQLEARGVEVWSLPCGQDGHRVSLSAFLKRVGQCGIQSLLIEGGAGVNGAFWDEGLVDEMFWFYAPLVIGGLKARTAIDGMGVERLEQALKPKGLCIHRIYGDILLHGMITDINGFFVRDI